MAYKDKTEKLCKNQKNPVKLPIIPKSWAYLKNSEVLQFQNINLFINQLIFGEFNASFAQKI